MADTNEWDPKCDMWHRAQLDIVLAVSLQRFYFVSLDINPLTSKTLSLTSKIVWR